MSLLPYFINDWVFERPHDFMQRYFGHALNPNDLLSPSTRPMTSWDYFRPWQQLAAAAREVGIKSDKDKFQINVDVLCFAPEEIKVKVVDGCIVVEGKHEEKRDEYGFVSRHFKRRYELPNDAVPEAVESQLSADGVLIITVPRTANASSEREVPITHTGPVRKEVKDKTDSAINNAHTSNDTMKHQTNSTPNETSAINDEMKHQTVSAPYYATTTNSEKKDHSDSPHSDSNSTSDDVVVGEHKV